MQQDFATLDTAARCTNPTSLDGGDSGGVLPSDPQLQALLAAWPHLPEETKAAILYLAREEATTASSADAPLPRLRLQRPHPRRLAAPSDEDTTP